MNTTESVNQRIKIVRNHYCRTREEFANKLGISLSEASKLTTPNYPIGTKKIAQITSAFPDIDANWLLYGQGSMLKSQEQTLKVEPLKDEQFLGVPSIIHGETKTPLILPNNMESINQRIEKLIRYSFKTKRDFCLTAKKSSQWATNLTTEGYPIGMKTIKMIEQVIPTVNIDWLLKGEGSMFKHTVAEESNPTAKIPMKDQIEIDRRAYEESLRLAENGLEYLDYYVAKVIEVTKALIKDKEL